MRFIFIFILSEDASLHRQESAAMRPKVDAAPTGASIRARDGYCTQDEAITLICNRGYDGSYFLPTVFDRMC